MKIYICPNCKEKHIYDGMIKHLCTRCTYPIIVDECESFSVEKEPFETCPFCDKKYDIKVTKCTFCGFGLESFDEVDELIEYHKSEQQKQEQQLEYELNNPCVPKCPTCQSPNIKKISGGAKMLGALGFGLFSKTARSQFECLNCGYKW